MLADVDGCADELEKNIKDKLGIGVPRPEIAAVPEISVEF